MRTKGWSYEVHQAAFMQKQRDIYWKQQHNMLNKGLTHRQCWWTFHLGLGPRTFYSIHMSSPTVITRVSLAICKICLEGRAKKTDVLILSTGSSFQVFERNIGTGIRHMKLPIQPAGTGWVQQVRLQGHLAPFLSAFVEAFILNFTR